MASHKPTRLRELYHVLGRCSTATHQAICEDLLRASPGHTPGIKLARLFQEALAERQNFEAIESDYIPSSRTNTDGRNPVTTALRSVKSISATDGTDKYEFIYLAREIPHLRTEDPEQESGKGWIDCVGTSGQRRPVLCEVKWKQDKDAFYGLIQLLTYLSEMATKNQIQRSKEKQLFGQWDNDDPRHDTLLLFVNSTINNEKKTLMASTKQLAEGFARCLDTTDFANAASVVGNLVCLSATLDEDSNTFGVITPEWWITR